MILALDPGKTHFAYTIISKKKGIVKTGMIHNVIDDFSKDNLTLQVIRFVREIKRLFFTYPIKIVVAERYQVRGRFGGMMGASCEYISAMLGIISCLFKKRAKIYFITPALWKNYMYKTYDYPNKTSLTEVFGFYGLSKNFSTVPILEHQFDSCGIGVWAANKFWNVDLYKKVRKRLIKLWKKGKPTSKQALKSYNKVRINVKRA